jgi:hypothetical protein
MKVPYQVYSSDQQSVSRATEVGAVKITSEVERISLNYARMNARLVALMNSNSSDMLSHSQDGILGFN